LTEADAFEVIKEEEGYTILLTPVDMNGKTLTGNESIEPLIGVSKIRNITETLLSQHEMRDSNNNNNEDWSRWEEGYKAAIEDVRKELVRDIELENSLKDDTGDIE